MLIPLKIAGSAVAAAGKKLEFRVISDPLI
jgi:hypothetical protein